MVCQVEVYGSFGPLNSQRMCSKVEGMEKILEYFCFITSIYILDFNSDVSIAPSKEKLKELQHPLNAIRLKKKKTG